MYNSANYAKNIELLLTDYELFRSKYFSNKCLEFLNKSFSEASLFLTHSATGGLEMIATLIDIQQGDEIIMPSFTFVSTANAFVAKGAIPVFLDIDPITLNIDEKLIEQSITKKTKAVIAMHYAGHPCNIDTIKTICDRYKIYMIEDAAMAFGATYKGLPLGSYGDFSVISFDITKQINAVQGGVLIVNNNRFADRANNVYHLGTNRIAFNQKSVQYYEWVDVGSKYQMNELNAAVLFEQLRESDKLLKHRQQITQHYYNRLLPLKKSGKISMMHEHYVAHNFHEFYILLNTPNERTSLQSYLRNHKVESMFHYIPLHLSSFGMKNGKYIGGEYSEIIAKNILRLPLHHEITEVDVNFIIGLIFKFFNEN